jgi:small subunit ribosomal protein S16
MGSHKRPFYRVVVAEEASRRDGRFIEIVGTYDPLKKPAAIEVESEAVVKWLAQGAQPTDTVKRILAKSGVWAHWQAVQRGEAEPAALTGRVVGTMERGRSDKPSKKAVARVAEEESKKAQAVATAAKEAEAAAAAAAAAAEAPEATGEEAEASS